MYNRKETEQEHNKPASFAEKTVGQTVPVLVLARYAKDDANFVLVVSGSLKAKRTKKFIEIVYDLLIKAIELGSFALLEFGVRAVGLK